ncbi:thioredoxin-like protein [Aspergillus tamarii]|uniref:Thioredoxin n=1 Tax=Aspergillus tamarii TaxID=41984 RepID=A0A5N6UYT7_ASPTM|nr:thioredoxin-like protein [Aspergillus tamarii]
MPIETITSYAEFQQLINGDKPVLIDFWATWCGPCRAISPVLEAFSNSGNYPNVLFYKVDVDQQEQIAQEVGIRAMPTFILFHKGIKAGEFVGADPRQLEQLVVNAASL